MSTSPQVRHLATVGIAYAAVNPPVDPLRATGQSELPIPQGAAFAQVNPPVDPERVFGGVSLVNHRLVKPSEVNVSDQITALQKPEPAWRRNPDCGLVTIKNDNWIPQSETDLPHSMTQGLGMELSAHFAMVYNQSTMARNKRRWAVVTNRGTVLILTGIKLADRPTNPADFPSFVESGLTFNQAEQRAAEANAPRLALAIVPRDWAIAVRRADSVEVQRLAVEGGAAC